MKYLDVPLDCDSDEQLLEFLLSYLTDSAYNSLIVDVYPDGTTLSPEQLEFNSSMILSQGMVPVMAFRHDPYYYSFNKLTGLTAAIPIDLLDS